MKTSCIAFIAIISLAWSTSAYAVESPYIESVKKNVQVLYTSSSVEALQGAVGALERIAAAEHDKWEPYYYTAFGYIMMANQVAETQLKDQYLDQALAAIRSASEINSEESENVALEGFVHMMRVAVDPGARGAQYSGLAMQTFGKAIAMNPNNPRALGLLAQMQYGTAKFFGSPTAEACNTVAKAMEKFESDVSNNPLSPSWGKEMTMSLKTACK